MGQTIFYSWQSDIEPGAACRGLIQAALGGAVASIAEDKSIGVEAPAIDRDTMDVPGSPQISDTIFSKIDAADVFVADVTIVNAGTSAKPSSNANVMMELGYALKRLSWDRMILVQNIAFGGPELLPFHLRQRRVITYNSPADAQRAPERKQLQAALAGRIAEILKRGPATPPDVALSLTYEKKPTSTGVHHDYEAVATIKNNSSKRLDDWSVDLQIPAPVLTSIVYGSLVEHESTPERKLFRAEGLRMKRPLHPGQDYPLRVAYLMTDTLYRRREELFGQPIRAPASVNGELVAEQESPLGEMQEF